MFGDNTLQIRPGGRAQCPLCRERILDAVSEEALYACPGCETVYHTACAHELGGCSTLGCPRQGKRPSRQDSARFTLSPANAERLGEFSAERRRRERSWMIEDGELTSLRLARAKRLYWIVTALLGSLVLVALYADGLEAPREISAACVALSVILLFPWWLTSQAVQRAKIALALEEPTDEPEKGGH